MQPLQDLLARIRWDVEFGKGAFALGYYDRIAEREELVPLNSVSFERQRPSMFAIQDEDGIVRHIPLHRVRTVYKNGVVIWQRPVATEHD
jgi:uncharacterized protein (UPF0248 family)